MIASLTVEKQGFVPPKHIVLTTALVVNEDDKILVIKAPDPSRGWEMPGGQLEEGEDLYHGVKREIYEETGISISVGSLVGIYTSISDTSVIFCFLAEYQSGKSATSQESLEVKWVDKGELVSIITQDHIAERAKDGLKYSGKVIYRAYRIKPYQVILENFFD